MDHHPRTAGPAADGGWAVPGCGLGCPDVVAEVQYLAGTFVAGAQAQSLGSQLVGLRQLIDQLEGVFASGAVAFDEAGGPADDGAGSLAAWIRHRCRIAPGEAQARVRVARAVTSGPMTTTGEALRDGTISWRHAQVIERTLRDVPADRREEAEHALQEPAKALDPMLLSRVGAELLHRLDADRADRAAVRRLERRGLDLAETFDGMVAVSGILDSVAGATVLAAVDAIVAPTRGDESDERSWTQRRADALAQICRSYLDAGDAPIVGGVRPHLSVMVDLAVLRKEPGCGTGTLAWAGPVTSEQVRMIACDSGVSRIVMHGPGQVLDVGRVTRSIPPAIRRAVVARDRHCVGPGCYTPPQHCDVHHIVFWEDGGETSLANCVLLCRRHHGFVHLRGWTVAERDDGSQTLVPPRPDRAGRAPPGGVIETR